MPVVFQRMWLPFFALLLGGGLCGQTAPAIGTTRAESVLLTIEGKVEVSAAGATTWSAAGTNQVLQVGDRLRTGLRSRATLRLSDKSVLRVSELTLLQIQPPPRSSNAQARERRTGSACCQPIA